MDNRKRVIAVVVIICIGCWWGVRYTPSYKQYQKVLAGALSLVQKADGYDKDPSYYDELAEATHRRIYHNSFDRFGRQRRHSKRVMRTRPYTWNLLKSMIQQAKRDGRNEFADALQVVFDDRYQGVIFLDAFSKNGVP